MAFFKEYVLSIAVASLLALILENLLPEDTNKKYVKMVVGLLLMLVIIAPLKKLPHYGETFSLPYLRLGDEDLSYSPKPYVAMAFEKNLALTMTEDVKKTFAVTLSLRVTCEVTDAGEIARISSVKISPKREDIVMYLANKYGIEEALFTQ